LSANFVENRDAFRENSFAVIDSPWALSPPADLISAVYGDSIEPAGSLGEWPPVVESAPPIVENEGSFAESDQPISTLHQITQKG